jgi:hypothetical protein
MRVERWKASGLTAKEFAAETGLKASTLTFWSWKLRREASGQDDQRGAPRRRRAKSATPAPKAAGRFVEVTRDVVRTTPAHIEVVLRGGFRIRVPETFDETTLTRVVRAVEAAR